jgi:maltose-binding protein MalE
MKKRVAFKLVLSLLLISSFALGACGPAATPTQEPTTEPTEVPPTEAPTPTEGPAPTLTIWADSLFAPIIEEISRGFTEEYGVNVVVQGMGMDEVREQMLIAAPAGEGPDLIEGGHDWLGRLVEGGVLAPIDLGEKEDLFLPAAIQAFTYDDGQLYALPMITENIALFRNPEMVPQAPTTWDELATICEEVEAGGIEYCLLLQEGDAYHFFPIMTSFGGYVFGSNPDGTYNAQDVGIDSPGSLAAAEWLDAMVEAGHIQAGTPFDTARTLYADGQAAMYLTGPWNIPFFQEAGIPYAISPIPSGTQEARPFMGVRGLMVNSFSENRALALTYLTEFWATEDSMQSYYEATSKPMAFLPVQEGITDPDIAALGEAGVHALPMPGIPEMTAFWGTMGDTITLIMQQQADPDDAFRNAAQQMRTLIAEGS